MRTSRLGQQAKLVVLLCTALLVGAGHGCGEEDNTARNDAGSSADRVAEPVTLKSLVAALKDGQAARYKSRVISGVGKYNTAMDLKGRRFYVFDAMDGDQVLTAKDHLGNQRGVSIAVHLGESPGSSATTQGVWVVMRLVPGAGKKHGLTPGTTYKIGGQLEDCTDWPGNVKVPLLVKAKVEPMVAPARE